MADYCPKLIEVALPIQEISFESARDKSLRHGHISTLHLWWARRPLAASRAIVFASLVPDPDDPKCPKEFKDKVKELLSGNSYKPYDDIPGTADRDPMPDTLRNRLLMFIAKFSREYLDSLIKGAKPPRPDEGLVDSSLVKWESGISKHILHIAQVLLRTANGGEMPKVLDCFAGGGAIPLEAARLGCESFANELNPVAHLIERAGIEFPRKYGKPVIMSKKEYFKKYQIDPVSIGLSTPAFNDVKIPNILSHDVKYWSNWIFLRAQKEIGNLYISKTGKIVVAYIWVRYGRCANPSCKAKIPLLKNFALCDTSTKKVILVPKIDQSDRSIEFDVISNSSENTNSDAFMIPGGRGNVRCPFCGQITTTQQLKSDILINGIQENIVAVLESSNVGKSYRSVNIEDLKLFNKSESIINSFDIPNEPMPITYTQAMPVCTWGFHTWGSLFNKRQMLALCTLVDIVHKAIQKINDQINDIKYKEALIVYMGILIDRLAARLTNMGIWNTKRETVEHPFGRQAIPLAWDYPEVNPFSGVTGGVEGQLDWIIRYIERENLGEPAKCILGSATHLNSIKTNSITAVVTDPPYYDAIAYADLSDFFYVWLKRSIGTYFPNVINTPLTPKSEEVTSLKHRHKTAEEAKNHFETLLCESFKEAKRVIKNDGVVTIMFAHQSTEAWGAFIKAILGADLTITASWPIDTENSQVGLKQSKSMLSSSVTVVCRKRVKNRPVSYKDIRHELEQTISQKIDEFWKYGFRGADLIVSAFGPAVGVFGKYDRVEKTDGAEVSVDDLLKVVREMAFKKIVGGLSTDEMTRIYVGWLNLYGTETQKWDDARQTIQIGTEINIQEASDRRKIFIHDGDKVRIALLEDRKISKLGESGDDPLIDMVHKSLLYWQKEDRQGLIEYLSDHKLHQYELYWKLLQVLFEVLPSGSIDWKLVQSILSDKLSLVNAAKQVVRVDKPEQMQMV